MIINTPIVKLHAFLENEIYAKLEDLQIHGSVKDRASKYVISKLLQSKKINSGTTIIESTSGNMGVALAATCQKYGLPCVLVIDATISKINEYLIKKMGAIIYKENVPDENNSYLKSRIKRVEDYIGCHENVYWFNQYSNPLVREAYEKTLGAEILEQIPDVNYIFMAVSSMGTIAGVSRAVERYNGARHTDIKLIAVDIAGSKIFDPTTKAIKHIPGIGSSIVAGHAAFVKITDHSIVEERESVLSLNELLQTEGLFLGGSSGCVFAGMKKYILQNSLKSKKILCVFADRGERYFDTLYNEQWIDAHIGGQR